MLPAMIWNLDAALVMLSDPLIVMLLAVQGILTIGLGFLWYYEGVQALGPMNAAVYINLVPIFGIVLAALTLGEVPDAPLLLGAAFVVGGLLLVNRAELRRARLDASHGAA
jgi:drug/metabolite transporter (DMT)-like permease